MAIKLADTARPNNYVDTEHPGTFPVAYAEDVWFADGTRLSEKTFDGQSVQKEELPLASADELGNIYQYVGESGTYINGYFYECVSDGESTPAYSWEQKDVQPSRYKSINFLTMTGAKYQCITGLKLGAAYLIEIGYNMFIVKVLNNFGDQSQTKYGFEIELLGQNLNDTTDALYNYPVYFNNFEDNALAPILAIYVSNGDRTSIRVTQISGVVNNDFDFGTFYTSTPSAPFKKSTFYSAASMREAIAPLFNDNTSYNVGDIIWKRVNTSLNSSRVHDNIELYRCIVAHSGSWSSAHFEKIQLCKDFKSGSKVFSGTMDEWDALTEAEKAKYDFIATLDEAVEDIAPFTKYFVISNSGVNVGESFYTNATNSFEVFKIVANTIFNDLDASGELTPYVGHATAYTTDSSGYPNMGVTTWVASACRGANGHPYIRIRIFLADGGEYRFQRSQDGTYALLSKEQYSTDERLTDKTWIDGKPIYRKVIDFGALPNASTKSINHNISNIDNWVNVGAIASTNSGVGLCLPYADPALATQSIACYATATNVQVNTGSVNRSDYTKCKFILEYTKTD